MYYIHNFTSTVVLSTLNDSPSTPARNCQLPTLACHSPAVTSNLSAVLSPVPNVLSSTCPSILVGGPIHSTPYRYHSTKQLVDLQLKRRSQQSSGRKFASCPLVQRVKKQNEHFKQIAQGIHHGGKEDLLAGIAHSVSCSTTKQNCSGSDWDGQLTVQDIVQLTKMVYDSKAAKTIMTLSQLILLHRSTTSQASRFLKWRTPLARKKPLEI